MHSTVDLELIKSLMAAGGDCLISIYIPTVEAGRDTDKNRIYFKNQLKALQPQLDPDMQESLGDHWQRLQKLEDDRELWQHTGVGMAWFVSAAGFTQISLPNEPLEHASVADRFFVRPLFAALEHNQAYWLLGLSQNQVTLYAGDGYALQEFSLPEDIPRSMTEALGEYDVDATQQSHSQGAPPPAGLGKSSGGPMFHDQDEGGHSKERVQKFLSVVASALQDADVIDNKPLVLAGVAYATDMFAELVGSRFNIIARINGNVDDQSTAELHAACWPVLTAHAQQQVSSALDQLRETDPAKVANTLEAAATAALQGKVEHLFYVPRTDVAGEIDEQTQTVRRHQIDAGQNGQDSVDLVDFALQQTISNGGRVHAVTSEQLEQTDDQPVAALLRY